MTVRRFCALAGALLAVAAVSGCGGRPGSNSPLPSTLSSRTSAAPFRFVGYWDGWQQNNLTKTPQGVTEIPIAFGYIHGHSISLAEITKGYVTAADIAALHKRGIKVTLSLGGWSPRNAFSFDGDAPGFEQSLKALLASLPFDGVDFDDEHGTTAQRVKDITTLVPATRSFFNRAGMPGAIVTYTGWNTPSDYGDDQILKSPRIVSTLSWVNVMSYENNDVARTESDLEAYGAIFDRSRLMMGVDIDDKPIPTNESLATLSSWVRANGYGGMMAWTVNSITPEQLRAIASK